MVLRELALPAGTLGRVYLSSMPGRRTNLAADISDMDSVRVSRIISFACFEEVTRKSPEYAAALNDDALGRPIETFAITDYDVPTDLAKFRNVIQRVVGYLEADERLLLHCGAGIGRTGTVATCLLMELGMDETTALDALRQLGRGPKTPSNSVLSGGSQRIGSRGRAGAEQPS